MDTKPRPARTKTLQSHPQSPGVQSTIRTITTYRCVRLNQLPVGIQTEIPKDTPPTSDVDVEASSESDGEHKAPAQEPLSLASVPNIARDTRYDPGDGAHIKLSKDITKRQAYGISVVCHPSL